MSNPSDPTPGVGFRARIDPLVRRADETMRAGKFFEAHELIEEAFRAASGDQRTFLHALAQLAASHHQLSLGRARAAVRTWHKARAKLSSLGLLGDELDGQMRALHDALGISAQAPRFIEVSRLEPPETWPRFALK